MSKSLILEYSFYATTDLQQNVERFIMSCLRCVRLMLLAKNEEEMNAEILL